MGPITKNLYRQIMGWRVYSVVAPAMFAAVSAFFYLHYGTPFENIFYTGLIVLALSCISWWHWSLSTMMSMLLIMKDTDDHFAQVNNQLENIRQQVTSGKPVLTVVKKLDSDK